MSNSKAIVALLTAVLALSMLPLILELTSKDSNPFLYVAIQTCSMTVALIIYLYSTAKKRFGTTNLREIVGPPKNLLVNSHAKDITRHAQSSRTNNIVWRTCTTIWHTVASWIRTPLLWAVIVGLEYSLFGWSIRYVDAAVTTIIYGLWPLITIYALVYLSKDVKGAQQYHIYFQKKLLTALALVGLIIVVIGQIEEGQPLLNDTMRKSMLGMFIALIAATLNGMNPAMSIHFSDLLYQRTPHQKSQNATIIAEQKLWLSVYAVAAGRLLSLPVNLGIGFIFFFAAETEQNQSSTITGTATLAAILSGLTLLPAASILLRQANLSISDLSINALCYAEPVFTIAGLMILTDIEVPRFDLFIFGVGVIVITNILIQAMPDINLNIKPNATPPPSTDPAIPISDASSSSTAT